MNEYELLDAVRAVCPNARSESFVPPVFVVQAHHMPGTELQGSHGAKVAKREAPGNQQVAPQQGGKRAILFPN